MSYTIGMRRELFVDDWLIDTMQGTRLQLQKPERREVALCMDARWEDSVAFPDTLKPLGQEPECSEHGSISTAMQRR